MDRRSAYRRRNERSSVALTGVVERGEERLGAKTEHAFDLLLHSFLSGLPFMTSGSECREHFLPSELQFCSTKFSLL